MSKRDEDRKKREKKQQDWLLAQITAMMEKAMKAALREAMDDLFRDWK